MPSKTDPIILEPYNPDWLIFFQNEALQINSVLGNLCNGIHHIGSTAIPHIYAKPVIDILVVVDNLTQIDSRTPGLEVLGYTSLGEYGIPGRRFYWKMHASQRYHIHLFANGNSEILRHLAFKKYLIDHPTTASGYSWIKRCLAEQFSADRLAYVGGKDSYIRFIDYQAGVAKEDQLNATDRIALENYQPHWPKLGLAEINAIKNSVKLPYVAIEHLGSTAVKPMLAKPVIDIFIALTSLDEAHLWVKPLEDLGYIYWFDNPDRLHHRFFKGMPPYGIGRTHHVHIMNFGKEFKDRQLFKNILCDDADIRESYGKLKQHLAEIYRDDREGYTAEKAQFIKTTLKNRGESG